MLAVIGGSGFEKFDGFEIVKELSRDTPFGQTSAALKVARVQGTEVLFLSRHGVHHELLPSEVNYRANIYQLKKHGCKAILSISAVGSLRREYAPGDLVIAEQYLDRTKGVRKHTFCGEGAVGHVSLAKPVCPTLVSQLKTLVSKLDFKVHFGGTYVCVEGPYFSTQAESLQYIQSGASIIGMTHFPEYALAREAGLPYLPCCFVTDYDCWDDSIPHVTLEGVLDVMRKNNLKAFRLLTETAKIGAALWESSAVKDQGLKSGLMTPKEALPPLIREVFSVLQS